MYKNTHIPVTEQTLPCDKFGDTCGGSDDTSDAPAPLFSRQFDCMAPDVSVGRKHVPGLVSLSGDATRSSKGYQKTSCSVLWSGTNNGALAKQSWLQVALFSLLALREGGVDYFVNNTTDVP